MIDEEFIASFPEINLENYDVVDVEMLNGWGIEAASVLATALIEHRDLRGEYEAACVELSLLKGEIEYIAKQLRDLTK
jgi:hypothetical protein